MIFSPPGQQKEHRTRPLHSSQPQEFKMAKNNKSEASKTPKLVPNKSAAAAAPARSEAITPRPPQPASDPESFERLNELIRIRAYQLYEQRGRGEGLDLE